MTLLTDDWNGRKFAAWFFCTISWGILVPILLYYLHIYVQVRNKQLIKKRYSSIVIFCNIITSIYLAISRPLSALYAAEILTPSFVGNLEHLLFTISIHCLNYCYLLRYWLLYYDIKWTVYSQKKTWYQYINADCTSCNNFWIKHHKTFGKPSYMRKIIIIPILIASFVTTYCFYAYHNNEKVYEFIEAILAPIPIIGELILFYSTPTFHDQIKLHHELKLFLIYACCAFSLWLTFPVVLSIYNHDGMHKNLDSLYFWLGYSYIIISSLFCFVLALITTYWVLNRSGVIERKYTEPYRILSHEKRIRYQKMISAKHKNDAHYVSIIDTTKSIRYCNDHSATPLTPHNDILGTPINDPNTLTLKQLLSTEYGFDAFIHHISQEFCVETLLSCVELIQFQIFYNVNEDDILLIFPECIPNSSIVYNVNYSCHDKIRQLCEKYILNGSDLELNISYRLRKDLTKLYNKIHEIPTEICKTFFNEVIIDMADLMEDSFYRFKKSKEYNNLKINKEFQKTLQKIKQSNGSKQLKEVSNNKSDTSGPAVVDDDTNIIIQTERLNSSLIMSENHSINLNTSIN
eukprot:136681_1